MAASCSVPDCDRPAAARGWCHMHWGRWRRHGDPLIVMPKRNQGRPVVDFDDHTRQCNDCGTRKPLADYPMDRNGKLGRRSICKPCHVVHASIRYRSDPERFKAKQRVWRLENIDEIRAKEAARYERDRPQRIAYATEQVHRRRALLRQVPFEPGITLLRLRRRHGDRCCYCDVVLDFTPATGRDYKPSKATIEHVVPLTRGGGHTWDNVRLACWQCNVRKNDRLLDEWTPDPCVSDADEQLRLFGDIA